jgi:hypothetical protein
MNRALRRCRRCGRAGVLDCRALRGVPCVLTAECSPLPRLLCGAL